MNTKIMGILNVTPDSCYDGGQFYSKEKALARAFQMIEEGADIIDVGGESTKPGASPVAESEELRRVLPVIQAIRQKSSIALSIDTMKPKVAEAAAIAGITMINDVCGFENEDMVAIAKKYNTELCVMHMQGNPKTMQINPHYPEGIISYLMQWFQDKIQNLLKQGIHKEKIYLDPGIGFGKTIVDNLKILQNVPTLLSLGFPLVLGVSRKSFLAKICSRERSQLLAATLTANTTAAFSGVQMLRVHDVKEHRDMLQFIEQYKARE